MILKPHSTTPLPADPRLRAGVLAERQMAHYLHRAFAASADLYVINDLRLVDPEQPEPDPRSGGSKPGVAQIDHLVLHRYGAFIVESKSVSGLVTVRDDGGGDEWTRDGKGMPSPLRQAERQGEFLRAFLQRHRERLLGRRAVGLRTISKMIHGDDLRGFRNMPVQHVVAIGDNGVIQRLHGWKAPTKGFAALVAKADQVPARLSEQFKKHQHGAGVRGFTTPVYGEYGIWLMSTEELGAVADFLVASHTLRTAPEAAPKPDRSAKPAKPGASEPPAAERVEPASSHTPPCPKCGTPTVLRYAKKGANAGQPFFGCPSFPKCRGVVAIAES